MENIKDVLAHYRIDDDDRENLQQLKPIMEKYEEKFCDEFYNSIIEFKGASKFFPDEDTIKRHKIALKQWFIKMFSGEHDNSYLLYLHRVGRAHVKIGVNVHFLNASMCAVRGFAISVIEKEIGIDERGLMVTSLNKIIDMNLDMVTASYREEELKTSFLSYRVESALIDFGTRFTYGLNLILVIALIVIAILVLGLFGNDIGHLIRGDVESGLISAIGSLLILWVMIELLSTEIKHLRGEAFSINVFVGVVLVAFIREVLIASFQEDVATETKYFFVVTILVLGFVYWLISKTEKKM